MATKPLYIICGSCAGDEVVVKNGEMDYADGIYFYCPSCGKSLSAKVFNGWQKARKNKEAEYEAIKREKEDNG